MARLFGTDGVRGIANTELTAELAMKLGQSGAMVLAKNHARPKILIGRDTRISGDMLEAALVAGLCAMGADVTLAGIIPTPGISYLVKRLGFDAGVVISASHNPVQYNGIKFFDNNGLKLPDEMEDEIQMNMGAPVAYLPSGKDVGMVTRDVSLPEIYKKFLASHVKEDFSKLTVVLDCSNGASAYLADSLFEGTGATVYTLYDKPDGVNINDHCGSTHPDNMVKYVKKVGADIGLAFDGDADRLIACDENGALMDGDTILGILALHKKQKGELRKDTLVVTVMSNLGLLQTMEKNGINVMQTAVGDRYVMEAMLKDGYTLGGEQSGHVIMTDMSNSGDGMQSGIALLNVMAERGMKASQLAAQIPILPQVLVNAHVGPTMKNRYLEDADIKALIEELEEEYKDNGRLLVRTSGTEHLIRVMIEGPDQEAMEKRAKQLADLMEQKLTE
ncbi:phosphoglucosamine mutase [Eubacteriales bacterium OttesenSCG-928-M02]|nr:phosphoglucosamine mutase [Eubacteriales bacterium OttesenSCG-928-M02]